MPYGAQSIIEEDIKAVVKALKQDYITSGEQVDLFEKKICNLTGAKYSVVCSSGTSALHLACLAMGLKKDDVAIVPTISFLATANAVRYCGANIIFADVCPRSGLMTPETFDAALNKARRKGVKVKAVLPVHLTGTPVELKEIKEISKNNDIKIIADSCHSIGGKYRGNPLGSCVYEDVATFSFHPVKTITSGEGGAVTTNSISISRKMRALRSHSMEKNTSMLPWEYKMKELGFNYRINDFQCALGISQLNRLERFVTKRQELVLNYNRLLSDAFPIVETRGKATDWNKLAPHLYSILIDFKLAKTNRQAVMRELQGIGIGTQVHYIPIHTQPYYKKLYGNLNLKGAYDYYKKTLSLPLFPQMKVADVEFVVKSLKSILNIL